MEKLRQEPSFSVEPERWCFTLPALHSFLQREDGAFGAVDYRRFRQQIFSSPIQRVARLHGAEIVVADDKAKVDHSTYALVWKAD